MSNAGARFFWFLLIVVVAHVDRVKAQDRVQARVVGFAVRTEGVMPQPSETAMARLGDRVTVKVEPLSTGANQQPGSSASANSKTADTNTNSEEQSWIPGLSHAQVLKLVPYLDDRPLKGLYSETVDPESHTLTFHLDRTLSTTEAWTDLLSNPGFDPRVMTFSVGLEDKQHPMHRSTTWTNKARTKPEHNGLMALIEIRIDRLEFNLISCK